MLTAMVPHGRAGIAVGVMLAVAVLTVHPNFELDDGIFHKGFETKAPQDSVDSSRLDCLASPGAALTQETSSTHVASNSDSLDLICVRIC